MNWRVNTGILKRAEFLAQQTMDALPLAICVLDAAGEVLATNELFRSLAAGHPLHQQVAVGAKYLPVSEAAARENSAYAAFIADVREVLSNTRDNIVHEYECPGGDRPRWYEARAVRLPGDKHGRVLISHSEITARREAQLRLQEMTAVLERTIGERTTAMQQKITDLEMFCHTVAHDLRSPMHAIEGYVHLLLQSHTPELSRSAREDLMGIARGVHRLSGMLDGLLDLSKSAQYKPQVETVDMTAIAHELATELSRDAAGRLVTVNVADMPAAQADPRLMRIALQNLMENAWKYTARTPLAKVEVGAVDAGGGDVQYFVRDNGVGFPASEAANAFLPFKRLSSAAGFAGSGVGLATVKRIIECHGGRVWAESSPGEGSTFYFTLTQ